MRAGVRTTRRRGGPPAAAKARAAPILRVPARAAPDHASAHTSAALRAAQAVWRAVLVAVRWAVVVGAVIAWLVVVPLWTLAAGLLDRSRRIAARASGRR